MSADSSTCSGCGAAHVRLWRVPKTTTLYCLPCAEGREHVRMRDESPLQIGQLAASFIEEGGDQRAVYAAWLARRLHETTPSGDAIYARVTDLDGHPVELVKDRDRNEVMLCVSSCLARGPSLSVEAASILAAGLQRFARDAAEKIPQRPRRRRGGTPSPKRAERDACAWNSAHPVGTRVRYWTGRREGPGVESRTRADAAPMSDHASVWVEGLAGSISLSHVEVIP